jgi:hypothetical protein
MVRYIRDTTGRFPERPYYEQEELDQECESIIVNFLRSLHREVRFPVATEDLKKLIERDADYLDCYADLSKYGADVEGITEFCPGQKPIVKIAAALTEDERRENRLRTTLTHEEGHVHFHAYLFTMNQAQGRLFQAKTEHNICQRNIMLDAPQSDWMEWQAGYICGALLMPASYIRGLVGDFLTERRHFGPVALDSQNGFDLIDRVVEAFSVSPEAARIRLLKLNYIGEERGKPLFD